jgi:hypothetical protein
MNALTTAMTTAPWLKKVEDSWRKAGQAMHDRITEAITGLTGPHAGKAAAFLGSHLGNAGFGAGGYDQAVQVLATLKAMDQSTAGVAGAIKAIESRLPRLQTDKADLSAAIAIAQGSDPKNVKLDKLNGIMADLRAHGDRTTRAKVQDLINAVKHLKMHVTVNDRDNFYAYLRTGVSTNKGATSVVSRYSNARYEYARGGAYPGGAPRLVGEDGPELDIPTGPGYVFTRDQTRALARALGSTGALGRSRTRWTGDAGAGGGVKLEVDVRPQPLRFVIDGRTLLSANVLSTAFVRS